MTNMKKFAAQKLSKKQMNEVKGGIVAIACTIRNQAGDLVEMQRVFRGETFQDAMNNLVNGIGNNNATNCKTWTE